MSIAASQERELIARAQRAAKDVVAQRRQGRVESVLAGRRLEELGDLLGIRALPPLPPTEGRVADRTASRVADAIQHAALLLGEMIREPPFEERIDRARQA